MEMISRFLSGTVLMWECLKKKQKQQNFETVFAPEKL